MEIGRGESCLNVALEGREDSAWCVGVLFEQ